RLLCLPVLAVAVWAHGAGRMTQRLAPTTTSDQQPVLTHTIPEELVLGTSDRCNRFRHDMPPQTSPQPTQPRRRPSTPATVARARCCKSAPRNALRWRGERADRGR